MLAELFRLGRKVFCLVRGESEAEAEERLLKTLKFFWPDEDGWGISEDSSSTRTIAELLNVSFECL